MNAPQKTEQARIMYPSGAAARLAGLPVETLRIWERRYSLSDAERSEHGQRLYSAEQVARLSLLKQLVDQGHAIGVLAGRALLRVLPERLLHRAAAVVFATLAVVFFVNAVRTVEIDTGVDREAVAAEPG